MVRQLGYAFFSLLLLGCGLDIQVEETTPLLQGRDVIINHPLPGKVYNESTDDFLNFSGHCSSELEDQYFILALRERIKVYCDSENNWTLDIDWQRIPEGENTVEILSSSGERITSLQFKKSFMPDHVILNQPIRNISQFGQIHSLAPNSDIAAMTYVSDEYCIVLGCSASNIVLRLSKDNYETVHFVTNDLKKSYSWPRVVQLDQERLRIFYTGFIESAADRNILYRDFDLLNETFSSEKVLTHLGEDEMLDTLQVEQKEDGEILIAYASKEYCSENSCNLYRAAVRSSKDNFRVRKDFGQESTCDVNMVRSSLRENTQDYYLFYNFERGTGSCTNWQNYFNHSRYDGSVWSDPETFTNGRNPGSAHFAIDNSGKIFVFHHSTWHGGCSGWALYYGSSQDNFASVNMVPGSCKYQHSYPNEHHRPSTLTSENGDIILLSARRGAPTVADYAHHLFVSNSSDNFSNPYVFYENDFSSWTPSVSLTSTPNSIVANVMIGSGSKSGLSQFRMNRSFTEVQRSHLSGPSNSSFKTVTFDDGKIGVLGQSTEFCETIGTCSNTNFYIHNLGANEKVWLTKITDPSIELNHPNFVARSGADDIFIYASNERNSKKLGSRFKTAADSFSTSTDFGSVDAETLPIITTLDLDDSNVVYAGGAMGKAVLFTSNDGFSSYTLINSDSLGGTPHSGSVRGDGEYALAFGSNGGGWKGRFRWSIDSFAADQYVSSDPRIKYGGWTPIWKPNNELYVFLLTDSNSDGLVDVSSLDSSDGFSTLSPFLTFGDKSLCRSFKEGGSAGTPFLKTTYDGMGRLNILYSTRAVGSSTCHLHFKRSDDWNRTWTIPTTKGVSLEPQEIHLQAGKEPVVCAQSLSNYFCMDLNMIDPTQD